MAIFIPKMKRHSEPEFFCFGVLFFCFFLFIFRFDFVVVDVVVVDDVNVDIVVVVVAVVVVFLFFFLFDLDGRTSPYYPSWHLLFTGFKLQLHSCPSCYTYTHTHTHIQTSQHAHTYCTTSYTHQTVFNVWCNLWQSYQKSFFFFSFFYFFFFLSFFLLCLVTFAMLSHTVGAFHLSHPAGKNFRKTDSVVVDTSPPASSS